MSNSNLHNHFPLPNLVAGGACGKLQGGRHLRYDDHTPMANLLLTHARKGRHADGEHRRQHGRPDQHLITHAQVLVSLLGARLAGIRRGPSLMLADAVKDGDRAAAIALLKQHADVNAPEPDGTTALALGGAARRSRDGGSSDSKRART